MKVGENLDYHWKITASWKERNLPFSMTLKTNVAMVLNVENVALSIQVASDLTY